MNTLENNKLIADFMGMVISSVPNNYWTEKNDESIGHGKLVELKYDIDWNWLMEVVEKIEGLKTTITNNPNLIGKFEDYEINIQDKFVVIYAHGEVTKDICYVRKETKKDTVYNACIEFIKWYKNQKS